jgi:hypothetical protein
MVAQARRDLDWSLPVCFSGYPTPAMENKLERLGGEGGISQRFIFTNCLEKGVRSQHKPMLNFRIEG